jgi:diguanylate cyclase (GGDEF)-like protein
MARLMSVVRVIRMADSLSAAIDKLRLANERLAKYTITDELTKLYNMRYFRKRLNQEFVRALRYGKNLSLIMFDMDNFKSVNDQNDHLMGSYVLAEVGKLVWQSIRSVDIGARFGGDEFMVMLPETGVDGALVMAERIKASVSGRLFDNGRHKLKITASFGVSTMGPDQEGSFSHPNELMRAADMFMYEAKELGRNRVIDRRSSQKPHSKN